MDPDAVVALARAALLELRPDEARAIAAALKPLLARLDALPPRTAEVAPARGTQASRSSGAPAPEEQVLRADVAGPALPRETALAGAPAVTASGLVQVGAPGRAFVTSASRPQGRS